MLEQTCAHVRVGISVFIQDSQGRFLLGKRRNSHGDGSWANPGGHLEVGETFEACARREVLEETGLEIGELRVLATTNDIFETEAKHYVTVHLIGKATGGVLSVREPEKVEEWRWFEPPHWPKPLFLPVENVLSTLPKHQR